MTQKDEIRIMLERGDWVCGIEFQKIYIPEYRSRINNLRTDGYVIKARKCQNSQHHHKGGMQGVVSGRNYAPRAKY